jgi:hypothetical protein
MTGETQSRTLNVCSDFGEALISDSFAERTDRLYFAWIVEHLRGVALAYLPVSRDPLRGCPIQGGVRYTRE